MKFRVTFKDSNVDKTLVVGARNAGVAVRDAQADARAWTRYRRITNRSMKS